MISFSGLVPSKSMIVSSLRNVRPNSVLNAVAVGTKDGDRDGIQDDSVEGTKEGLWVRLLSTNK